MVNQYTAMIVVVKSFSVDMLRPLLFLFLSGHTTVFTVLAERPKFNPKWVEDGREINYGSLMSVWFLYFSYCIDLQQRGRSLSQPLKITEKENNNSDTAAVLILMAGHSLPAAPGCFLSRAVK